jgi:hypothetical protein
MRSLDGFVYLAQMLREASAPYAAVARAMGYTVTERPEPHGAGLSVSPDLLDFSVDYVRLVRHLFADRLVPGGLDCNQPVPPDVFERPPTEEEDALALFCSRTWFLARLREAGLLAEGVDPWRQLLRFSWLHEFGHVVYARRHLAQHPRQLARVRDLRRRALAQGRLTWWLLATCWLEQPMEQEATGWALAMLKSERREGGDPVLTAEQRLYLRAAVPRLGLAIARHEEWTKGVDRVLDVGVVVVRDLTPRAGYRRARLFCVGTPLVVTVLQVNTAKVLTGNAVAMVYCEQVQGERTLPLRTGQVRVDREGQPYLHWFPARQAKTGQAG